MYIIIKSQQFVDCLLSRHASPIGHFEKGQVTKGLFFIEWYVLTRGFIVLIFLNNILEHVFTSLFNLTMTVFLIGCVLYYERDNSYSNKKCYRII